MKFITVHLVTGEQQYVSVDDNELDLAADQFREEPALVLRDARSGTETHFAMNQVKFMTIAEHRDER